MKYIILVVLMIGELFATGTIMIEVAYKGENYSITRAWAIEQTFPPTMQGIVASDDDIIIELKDANSTVVDKLRIENPRIIRGILPEVAHEEGHEDIKEEEGSFVLRYAYDEGLKYLNIINANGLEENVKKTTKTKEKVEFSSDMEFRSLLE